MSRFALSVLLLVVAFLASAGPVAAQPPAESTPEPSAAAAPSVETAPTPKTWLYVKTLPPGATVTLDGRPLGPSDGLFLVPAGTGRVSVQLSKQAGVPIGLDLQALEKSGIDRDTPVTLTLADRPLAVVLDRILEPLDLTFDLTGDRLIVTTNEGSGERLSAALYPLPPDRGDLAALITIIMNNLGRESWGDLGGAGDIDAIDGDTNCLIISQTAAMHRKIAAFLRTLE